MPPMIQDAQAFNDRGVDLYSQGKTREAIAAFQEALRLNPQLAEAHNNLANILQDNGMFAEAILGYRHALQLNPGVADFHYEYGNALRATGQLPQAEAAYREALHLDPDHLEARCNLGRAVHAQGRPEEAIAWFRAALAGDPEWVDPLVDLGNALKESGRDSEAAAAYREVVQRKPDHAGAHNNLALMLAEAGRAREAIANHRRATTLLPESAALHSNLLATLNYDDAADGQEHFQEAQQWAGQHAEALGKNVPPHGHDANPDRRLRVAYVSPDFCEHSVSCFLAPLLEQHDHVNVEVFCYADVRHPDSVTESLRRQADVWKSIVGLSDAAAAELIRGDKIDLLVDLAGHTARNRLLLFARKPAPVQISYLGYPSTTGLAAIDYRLTDGRADPPGETESLHTEKLWRLPATAWCFASPGEYPPVTLRGGEGEGGGNGGVCFGSFNNFAKVSPRIAELWGRILEAVPGSRLLLKAQGLTDPDKCQRVRAYLADHAVDVHRLELHPGLATRAAHLSVYGKLDIALDTFPYHGTTTTCEALWMGVPVVTLVGKPHVSRVGASLLGGLGLTELIAHDPEEYIAIAVKLAADAARRAELRSTLRQIMRASPLMDAPQFARDVEAAYRQMWKTWCAAHGNASPPR